MSFLLLNMYRELYMMASLSRLAIRCAKFNAQVTHFSSYRKASPLSQIIVNKYQELGGDKNAKMPRPQQIKLRDIMPSKEKNANNTNSQNLSQNPRLPATTPKPETERTKRAADVCQSQQQLHPQCLQQQQQPQHQQQQHANLSPASMMVRLERQIEEAKRFSIQNFGKDMVEVSDALAMALSTIPPEQLNIPALKNVFEGLKMIEALLQQVFGRHGLQQINPLHEKFDPRYHEALNKRSTRGVEANTIVEVGRVGYKLHNRCIRPALVVVAEKA